ncbi:VWA domain-containing protein [Brachyspira hyodysenteriae]|nr:VWA domain-containing protein [Brachyspira hyodysenteriae]MDA1470367.1 VWA domain-containing protein [Brachyspira hyodysenteriae]
MLDSVIYSSIMASIFSNLPYLSVKLVIFDTSIVDLSDHVKDPIDILFKVQLGGGTDISLALEYAKKITTAPDKTIVLLISDLYDYDYKRMYKSANDIIGARSKLFVLPALDYNANASYDKEAAKQFSKMGAKVAAITPDELSKVDKQCNILRFSNIWKSSNIFLNILKNAGNKLNEINTDAEELKNYADKANKFLNTIDTENYINFSEFNKYIENLNSSFTSDIHINKLETFSYDENFINDIYKHSAKYLKSLDKLISLSKEDFEDYKIELYKHRGDVKTDLNMYDDAIEDYKKALKLNLNYIRS